VLTTFLEKAKTTTKKYWKWILGVLIAVIVAYVAWRLKRQQDELDILRAEKLLFEIKARDLKTEAANQKDEKAASALRDRAESYIAAAAGVDTAIKQLESNVAAAKESVKNAQDWQELEKQARGK